MKQPMLIAAAVLVPFAALIAWGLWPSAEQPRSTELPQERPTTLPAPAPAGSLKPEPLLAPVPLAPPPEHLEPAQAEPPPPVHAERATPVNLGPTSPAHQAALTAVRPLVDKCIDEHRGELSGKVKLRIGFSVSPSGAMRRPSVKMEPLDPYLQACVEDLFEQTTLELANGTPEGQVQGAFDFDPAQQRR